MDNNKVRGLLAPIEVVYKFGNKGEFPVRGFIKTVGVNSRGRWFPLLCAKKVTERNSLGVETEGIIYIERSFNLSNVVKGAEKIAPLFEGLEA